MRHRLSAGLTALLSIPLLGVSLTSIAAGSRSAAVMKAGLPGEDPALVTAVETQLSAAGYTVTEVDADSVSSIDALSASKYDLLVLPDSSTLPAASAPVIDSYLRHGGDLIALNAPMWQRTLIRIGGRWLTRDQYQLENAGVLPENIVVGFGPGDLSGWTRNSDFMDHPTTYETVADGPAAGQRALHVIISNQQGYDTYRSPELSRPFANGETLTTFSAKGDKDTSTISIEWGEKDGSRWVATVPLTTQWKRFVLKPDDFRYWQSNLNRGFSGDRFHPENAVNLTFGMAYTHTGFTPGRHEYWIGPFGTARMNPEYTQLFAAYAPPMLDTLSPGYKLFDCTGVTGLKTRIDQAVVAQAEIPCPSVVRSPQPRPRGGGFEKGRAWRFIPVLDARTAAGQWRGTPATLMVNTDGPYKGSVWASFGIQDGNWYKSPAGLSVIRQVAEKMANGVFIVDGGTNYYTYFDDQAMKLGVRAINVGSTDQRGLTARVVLQQASTGKVVMSKSWMISPAPGSEVTVSDLRKPSAWPPGGFYATAEIISDGKVIDRVVHDVNVWRPKKAKSFVSIKDGDFMLNGRKWRVHGVNYMPSSGIGTEDGNYFEAWIGARSYDPEVIQRDLSHMEEMGLNAVSIFIYRDSMEAQNLLDLLRRLDALGMKANVSLRPGTPIDFPWKGVREMIQYYRLKENDTVFAYDLAWEPWLGTHDARKILDADWEKWIVERYGSIENAEKDWGYAIPRDESGKVTNPFPEQFVDGKWRVMTAAYRRFTDTLLYKRYNEARRLIRTIDPNHHVSFRMSEAGNPTIKWPESMPYDFPYVSAAVDILEPEAYGRIGTDWEKVNPGWYEFEYARWADARKPMVWAEMGCSSWDMGLMQSTPEKLQFEADYFKLFYRMMNSSGSDGIFYWWYPGGFRTGENSDFGIINPDGSDRPATKVIRENARAFLAGPVTKPVNHYIEFDRDRYPIGMGGVYDDTKAEFWGAIAKGQTPGLKTAGTGTTSANCPLLAVGNTQVNGTNPPKYLDGAFDLVEVLAASGKWVRVEKGGSVLVNSAKPVRARVTLTNLGEAQWLAKSPQGTVYLTISRTKRIALPVNVAYHGSVVLKDIALAGTGESPASVELSLLADGRTPFGERFPIGLRYR